MRKYRRKFAIATDNPRGIEIVRGRKGKGAICQGRWACRQLFSRFSRVNSFPPDDCPRVSKINYAAAGKRVYYWPRIRELERPSPARKYRNVLKALFRRLPFTSETTGNVQVRNLYCAPRFNFPHWARSDNREAKRNETRSDSENGEERSRFRRPLFLRTYVRTSSLSAARYREGEQSMPDSSHRCPIERCVRDSTANTERSSELPRPFPPSARRRSARHRATRVIKWYK